MYPHVLRLLEHVHNLVVADSVSCRPRLVFDLLIASLPNIFAISVWL
jgi:hypothetical protein